MRDLFKKDQVQEVSNNNFPFLSHVKKHLALKTEMYAPPGDKLLVLGIWNALVTFENF